MATQPPLSQLTLVATSVAEDLSFVALDEISKLRIDGQLLDFRLIGGHMVSLHVLRWQLGRELYRETLDADVGVLPVIVKSTNLLDQIRTLGYERVEGNRFVKTVEDIPGDASGVHEAIIDILIPAFRSRARDNVRVGYELVTTEVLGLAEAFKQEPMLVDIQVTRMNGDVLEMQVRLPDEATGLVLKAFAWEVRSETKDAIDLWRMLEVNAVAGVGPESFVSGQGPRAAEIIRHAFSGTTSLGTRQMAQGHGISSEEALRRHTRIQALIQRVLG